MDSESDSSCSARVEGDELRVPRAAMNKLIKEICPSVRVANETRDLVLACCSEFVRLVSSEANERCGQLHKKTISGEHVLQALDTLGFSDYRAQCERVLVECKDVQARKRRRQSHHRLERLGIPEEELVRQQQELFARARLAVAQQEANVHQHRLNIIEEAGRQSLQSQAGDNGDSSLPQQFLGDESDEEEEEAAEKRRKEESDKSD